MRDLYLQIASTGSVIAARKTYGPVSPYSDLDESANATRSPDTQPLTETERAFISQRDGFYIGSVSEAGWPYVQFRGGAVGLLKVLDNHTLGYADFRGNRQYITIGNVVVNDRVSLFLMDYRGQQRLKIFGRLQFRDVRDDAELAGRLAVPGYRGLVERAGIIDVKAFDWNCSRHVPRRLSQPELDELLAPLQAELASLRVENNRLRQKLKNRSA